MAKARPNQYPMPAWAEYQVIRESGLVENVCEHGVGHPNAAWLKAHASRPHLGVHGRDGCCAKKGDK